MARIRTIKPEFWTNEDLALLSSDTRLMAIGLLNMADDEGYFKAHPMLVKSFIFPFSDNSLNIHGMLNDLLNIGYIDLMEGSDGKKYGCVRNFTKHQRVNRPQASKIGHLCVVTYSSVNIHGTISDGKEQGTGKGTGKGKDIYSRAEPDNECEQNEVIW